VAVAKDTVQSCTQVASVRVPAAHDVVSCPDSEYPASHTGTQLDPDASSVSPAHVPAAALSGFVSFGYVDAIQNQGENTPTPPASKGANTTLPSPAAAAP
jgi:hypothetical protein